MSNAELLQYKRYLQKYVFAGWEAPDDLKEWVRLLERHIMHSDLMEEKVHVAEEVQHGSKTDPAEALTAGKHAASAQCSAQACLAMPVAAQSALHWCQNAQTLPLFSAILHPSNALCMYINI